MSGSMSGQQYKGGQQQYGQPYPGNPYYMNQNSLYNQNGLQSGMGGSYFSQGGTARGNFGSMQGSDGGFQTGHYTGELNSPTGQLFPINPGGSARGGFAPYGSYAQLGGGSGMSPVGGNPFQGASSGGNSGNPFQGSSGGGAFSMPGQTNPFQGPQAKPYVRPIDASVNPFQTPAQFGPTPPQNFDYTQTPTVPNTNDPNSPAYAAYYNSLPASTRSYLAPPGSGLANYIATNYNNSPFKF